MNRLQLQQNNTNFIISQIFTCAAPDLYIVPNVLGLAVFLLFYVQVYICVMPISTHFNTCCFES